MWRTFLRAFSFTDILLTYFIMQFLISFLSSTCKGLGFRLLILLFSQRQLIHASIWVLINPLLRIYFINREEASELFLKLFKIWTCLLLGRHILFLNTRMQLGFSCKSLLINNLLSVSFNIYWLKRNRFLNCRHFV